MKIYTSEELKPHPYGGACFKRFGVRRTPTPNRYWYLTSNKLKCPIFILRWFKMGRTRGRVISRDSAFAELLLQIVTDI